MILAEFDNSTIKLFHYLMPAWLVFMAYHVKIFLILNDGKIEYRTSHYIYLRDQPV